MGLGPGADRLELVCSCLGCSLPPGYPEPMGSPSFERQARWPRPFARWILAAVYLALIFTILRITSCYAQVFRQLVRTQGALELAEQRGSDLAERVAWLEGGVHVGDSGECGRGFEEPSR